MSNTTHRCITIVWANFYTIHALTDINIYFIDHESLVKSDFTGVCEENSCISHYDSDDASFVDCIHFDPPEDSLTPTESVEVDIFYTAPPLKDLYRYHIFFSHSLEDSKWISGLVHRLESEPYSYKCHYNDSVTQTKQNVHQTLMSAVILSERVVIVLSPSYVKSNWNEFQELLQNLTTCSLYQQRMLVVLLKDCNIPDHLQPLGFLDARECDFFDCLVRHLRSGNLIYIPIWFTFNMLINLPLFFSHRLAIFFSIHHAIKVT